MPRERPGMLRTLLADVRWVAVSLVAAVIVFYAVRGKISHTATVAVPVAVEQEPGLAVLAVEPFSVRVTFRGAAPDLQQLGLREMRVRLRPHVDAAAVGADLRLRVRARDVQGRPSGARVVAVEPAFVSLTFDHQDEMVLPVAEPPVEGRPLQGRLELEYAPRVVLVKGARRQLAEWKAAGLRLPTEPVNVSGRVQGFSATVRVLPPGGASPVEVTPREIAVRVSLLTAQSTRELRGVPVLAAAPPDRAGAWRFDPPTVDVRVTGRSEVVQALAPEALLVVVDLRGAGAEEAGFAPVVVHLPPDVAVDRIEATPAAVFVAGREN